MYNSIEKFVRAYPTPRERIEVFVKILEEKLSIILLSMKPGKSYSLSTLYKELEDFYRFDPIVLFKLISKITLEKLKKLGMVEASIGYQKTSIGENFGDPIAAKGIYIVNEMLKFRTFFSFSEILARVSPFGIYSLVEVLYREEKAPLGKVATRLKREATSRRTKSLLFQLEKIGLIDFDRKSETISSTQLIKILWEKLFEPIRALAFYLTLPNESKRELQFFQNNPEELQGAVRNILIDYFIRKQNICEPRSLILLLLRLSPDGIEAREILEEIYTRLIDFNLCRNKGKFSMNKLLSILENLESDGVIKREGERYYINNYYINKPL